jgi:hypothetical protein
MLNADHASQLVDLVAHGCLAVANGYHVGAKIIDFQQTLPMLFFIEVESGPAQPEIRPSCNRIPGVEKGALVPMERHVARRVSWRVNDLHRADPIPFPKKVIRLARRMPIYTNCEAKLDGICAQWRLRDDCASLRLSITG